MKKLIYSATLLLSSLAFSQVGINTETPKATLDVVASPADATKTDGLIAPRLTGNQLRGKNALYTADQTGTLVYVTAADSSPAGKTVNVTAPGYYYFDGVVWQRFKGEGSGDTDINIYNADGTLTGDRTLTQAGYRLTFTNTGQKTTFRNSIGTGIQQDSGSGTRASIGLSNGNTTSLWLYSDTNSSAQILATGNSTSLNVGTNNTSGSAPITFTTNSGGTPGSIRAQIHGDGRFTILTNLSIGYTTAQTFTGTQKLKVNGSIVTTGATYPDYVFEDYYNNTSSFNNDYKFQSIYDTEKFIKENMHLPGVTSIKNLEKTIDGYSFNISELSIQTLEKVEELYLHTIEQQKQIDELKELVKTQQSQINQLLSK